MKSKQKNNDVIETSLFFCLLSYLNIGIEYPSLAVMVWFAERPKSSSLELLKISARP